MYTEHTKGFHYKSFAAEIYFQDNYDDKRQFCVEKILATADNRLVDPGLLPYKKQGNHRKSYMVVYENIKVIESSIEVYGNMQVIRRPYYSMIPCKSYTVP